MFRTSKEEWEWKKSYLIRSLFEDLPQLSQNDEIAIEVQVPLDSPKEKNTPIYSSLDEDTSLGPEEFNTGDNLEEEENCESEINEEWEWKKSYLIRSLFEDLPPLSPINESQEPTQSSSDSDLNSSESTLPELIIEKELPRHIKYKQDESEDYYKNLYRNMKKLLRRDCPHDVIDITSSCDDSCQREKEKNTPIYSSLDEDTSLGPEEFNTGDNLEEEENCESEINEEWEWKKSYLIRSLFEDLPPLSPINESQEPTQSSSDSDLNSSESPLPELIIEKELPRHIKYKQDESEDYYKNLYRNMKKLLRRDCPHDVIDITSSCDDSCQREKEKNTPIYSSLDEDTSLGPEEFNTGDNLEEEENCESEINDEEIQYAITTSPNNDSTDLDVICTHEEMTIEVQVHSDCKDMSVQPMQEILNANEVGFNSIDLKERTETFLANNRRRSQLSLEGNRPNVTGRDSETIRKEAVRPTEQESVAKTIEATPSKSPDDDQMMTDITTPEPMRQLRTEPSDDTLLCHDILVAYSEYDNNSSESTQMEKDRTFSIEKCVTSGLEKELTDSSFSDSNIMLATTSTPKSSQVRRSKMIDKYTSRLVPYTPSPTRSTKECKSKRHVALQPSFSDDEPDLSDIWHNFFVGTPIVYNVCSRRNHVCS